MRPIVSTMPTLGGRGPSMIHRGAAVVGLAAGCLLSIGCTGDADPPVPADRPPPSVTMVAEPLDVAFRTFADGAWERTFPNGRSMRDHWRRGPGGHSMIVERSGDAAGGGPWRSLRVLVPGDGLDARTMRLLGLTPDIPGLGRGVAEGTFRTDRWTAEARLELHQPGHPGRSVRSLLEQWRFDGPDRYEDALYEDAGDGMLPLASWTVQRTRDAGPGPAPVFDADVLVPELAMVARLVGDGCRTAVGGSDLVTRVAAIPEVGALHARTSAARPERADAASATTRTSGSAATDRPSADPAPVSEVFVYHHPGHDDVRCLVLLEDATVLDGTVKLGATGGLDVALSGARGATRITGQCTIDFPADGVVRVEGRLTVGERTQAFAVHLER